MTVVVALVIRITVAFASQYTNEDYMITLRYAENLAGGHGLVYNVGERVLGTTTPLYTLFLALVALVRQSPTLCGKGLNILSDSVLCLLLYAWLRHERLERAGRVAAFIAAIHPLNIQWAISGMETSLVATCGVWSLYALSRRSIVETYVALGILFLLRWDTVLLAAVITAVVVLRDRRLPLAAIGTFMAIVAPWLIVSTIYYGNPIPVTARAKMTVYGWEADHLPVDRVRIEAAGHGMGLTRWLRFEPTWLLRRFPTQQKLLNFVIGMPGACALTIAACTGLWLIIRHRSPVLLGASLWCLFYVGSFMVSRVLLFSWYLIPPMPIYTALAAIGLDAALTRMPASLKPRGKPQLVWAALAACAVVSGWTTATTLRRSQRIEADARIPMGVWLRAHARSTDRVLLEPIGYIGYYSHRSIIDVIGLVSPDVLQFYGASTRSPWLEQVIRYEPEWCVLRPIELDDLRRAAAAQDYSWDVDYSLAHTETCIRDGEDRLDFYAFHRNGLSPVQPDPSARKRPRQ